MLEGLVVIWWRGVSILRPGLLMTGTWKSAGRLLNESYLKALKACFVSIECVDEVVEVVASLRYQF